MAAQLNAIPCSYPSPLQCALESLVGAEPAVQRQQMKALAPAVELMLSERDAQVTEDADSSGDDSLQLDGPPMKCARIDARSAEARTPAELARLEGELFPPFEGVVLLATAAALNHSCEPNCAVRFGDALDSDLAPTRTGWAAARVHLMRSVEEGEELRIGYIDPSLPLSDRRGALQALHGFVCRCDKCALQQALRRSPPDVAGRHELASRALQAGLYDEARRMLRRILQMDATVDGGGRSDGTALLQLGGALLRLHRFAEAREVWREGADRLPAHPELAREAAVSRAYHNGAGSHGESGGGTAGGSAAGADEGEGVLQRGDCEIPGDLESIWMSKGRCAFVTTCALLARDSCACVVAECEAHAAAAGGWSTTRHTTVPTTDLEVHAVPAVLRWFNAACEREIFPLLEACYGAIGVRASAVRVSDAFVVRYDAAAQSSLPVHADDSHLSLTIALNDLNEYEGGGILFEELGRVVRPDCGGVVCFPGSLRHGGNTVTKGVRYIIAAFLWVEGFTGAGL
eukprot:3479477-Prymnesium_polylepis.1